MPISVTLRSEAYNCDSSIAEIEGSNPTEGMDVCLFCLCFVGRGLCDGPITLSGEFYGVCVCVCVCVRERERERSYATTTLYTYNGVGRRGSTKNLLKLYVL
jgi:hypothetical protein